MQSWSVAIRRQVTRRCRTSTTVPLDWPHSSPRAGVRIGPCLEQSLCCVCACLLPRRAVEYISRICPRKLVDRERENVYLVDTTALWCMHSEPPQARVAGPFFTKCRISLQFLGVTRAVVTEIDFLVYFVITCTYHCISPTLFAFLHKFLLFFVRPPIPALFSHVRRTCEIFSFIQ